MKRFLEVHYFVKDGKRGKFYAEVMKRGIAAASRAEAGNEKYDYYLSPENENELLLLEIWTTEEAAKLHAETAHFKALGELKAEYVEKTVIMRSDISELP